MLQNKKCFYICTCQSQTTWTRHTDGMSGKMIRQVSKKSKTNKVITWLANNKDKVGADKSFYACDIIITRNDNTYNFFWNKISGSIECENRPKPTTLKINN